MFKVSKCKKTILSYKDLVSKYYYDIDFVDEKINELCFIMKEMAPLFTKKDIITDDYIGLVKSFNDVEKELPNRFIIDNSPYYDFDYNVRKEEICDFDEVEIIKYIVQRVRGFLIAHYSLNGDVRNVNLGRIDLLGQCNNASVNVNFICQAIKIPCKIYTIPPAFCSESNVYGKGGNHQFCLVTIGNKKYIVDLTYSQFFLMRENYLNRLGIPLLGGCHPGVYMTLDERNKNFAEILMRDGFIEASDENLKLYLDGFAISYRNGLYYEDMDSILYTTNYTADDYRNFLEEKDSQVNHEPVEMLGRQKRLLKDKYKNFNIKNN